MIPKLDVAEIDLGKDMSRMSKDHADRQSATVSRILDAFFSEENRRREVQLLADEVGMGKTFVALAVAYATLSQLNRDGGRQNLDLKPCYRTVLVVTPAGNYALTQKWKRETEAFLTRCSKDRAATDWFKAELCESTDELLQCIRRADDRRRKTPVLLVANASIFTKKLSPPAIRFMLGGLFRWWGNGLPMRERFFVLRGLSSTPNASDWADYAVRLGRGEYEVEPWDFKAHDRYLTASDREREQWAPQQQELFSKVSVSFGELGTAIERFVRDHGEQRVEEIRLRCKDVPLREPGDRRTVQYATWYKYFYELKCLIRDLYKDLWPYLLQKQLPLVISDEAHHFRHAQRRDCSSFRNMLAPFTQRLLLLTATPLQLGPVELIKVLETGDCMESSVGAGRVSRLRDMRDRIETAMAKAVVAGADFSAEWGRLAEQFKEISDSSSVWLSETIRMSQQVDLRTELIARYWASVSTATNGDREGVLVGIDGALRPFFRQALRLRDANRDLQRAMSPLVIRHRRNTAHRRYWVGEEYPPVAQVWRPDRSRLHLARGKTMPTDAELAQYLLMRVVAGMKKGAGRTTLAADLTGSYRTLWKSEDGRRLISKNLDGDGTEILSVLRSITAHDYSDNHHPKLKSVAEEVIRRWRDGEKSLVFCFRVPTAMALHDLLSRLVKKEMEHARRSLFRTRGTADASGRQAMQQFRRSLTARESSGVPLFLDRVLFAWLDDQGLNTPELTDEDRIVLSELCSRARYRGKLLFPNYLKPDRVFLHRAVEHVFAKRLIAEVKDEDALLAQIADEDWIKYRYGEYRLRSEDGTDLDRPEYHARSSASAVFDLDVEPDPERSAMLLASLRSRPRGGRASVLDSIVAGPNLMYPVGSSLDEFGVASCKRMRDAMMKITYSQGFWDWEKRARVLDALIRAFLREDMLLRLPNKVFSGSDETWAESLLKGLHEPGNVQKEPLAERMARFLDELKEMGSDEIHAHLRYAMQQQAQSVEVVTGEIKSDRDAIFSGFNTPLLPDILVCTDIGGEGIDLHRQCRHVVHYDLDWNPARLEQRTGRVDRIGSKAERERAYSMQHVNDERELPGLDIGLPYLAGTYDERIFEVLRKRAQMFEILTGGDPTADRDNPFLWLEVDNSLVEDSVAFVPLPDAMLQEMRLDLAVWHPQHTATDVLVS